MWMKVNFAEVAYNSSGNCIIWSMSKRRQLRGNQKLKKKKSKRKKEDLFPSRSEIVAFGNCSRLRESSRSRLGGHEEPAEMKTTTSPSFRIWKLRAIAIGPVMK